MNLYLIKHVEAEENHTDVVDNHRVFQVVSFPRLHPDGSHFYQVEVDADAEENRDRGSNHEPILCSRI